MDADSRQWLAELGADGRPREQATERLHAMLLRVTRKEMARRSFQLRVTGPELDDLAHQAAADAMLALLKKLDQFRGESRFTTWAYAFAIFEVSSTIGRHFWRHPATPLDAEDWDRLPDRLGVAPEQQVQARDLADAVRRAVDAELTPRQRRVFVAIVVNGIPLDALVVELGTSRNAIYKTLFDARRKLSAVLAAHGYLGHETARPS